MIRINKNIVFSENHRPVIIAEISANHCGKKKLFLKLINDAHNSGADAVKIQSYEPKDITINSKSNKFRIQKGIWKGKYLWDIYKKTQTPFEWHKDAFKLARRKKITLFSTPFSLRAVDLLEKEKVKFYKIASLENDDEMLIKRIAKTKKPIILSSGATNFKSIQKTLNIINKYHNKVIILHCVSEYPTASNKTNLNRITKLKNKFKKNLIGISDHTNDIDTSLASVPLGAIAIEKHFKLKNKTSLDSKFSITSDKFKILREKSEIYFKALGKLGTFKVKDEFANHKRSLFAKEKILKNQKFSTKNIISLRPLVGIRSSDVKKVLKKKAKRNIKKDSPIYLKDIL
tara:strand:+ start:1052 stop:2086 length:1035 start_codon:yes stop_codon:yes gene_type:complete